MEGKILKIGGSVLTHKDRHSELNRDAVVQIAKEIRTWLINNANNKLILISGGGSFGHPLAKEYKINEPTTNKNSIGFIKTIVNMSSMAQMLTNIFIDSGVPLFPITPSSIFISKGGRIYKYFLDTLVTAFEYGFIPFLWGDAIIDINHKCRILSGDQINAFLFEMFDFSEILYGTNVDGVLSGNPLKDNKIATIEQINDNNISQVMDLLSGVTYEDVTSGMEGKLQEIINITKRPVRSVIFNAEIPGNIYKALSHERVGTEVYLNMLNSK